MRARPKFVWTKDSMKNQKNTEETYSVPTVNSHKIAKLLNKKDTILNNYTIKPIVKMNPDSYTEFIPNMTVNKSTGIRFKTYRVTKKGCLLICEKLKKPNQEKLLSKLDEWFGDDC